MKRMIKMAMVAAGMFMVVTTVAKAQDAQQQGGRRGGGQMAAMMKDITLTDAQKAKVDSITKVYADKGAAIRASANGDMASVMPKMQDNTKARNEAIKAVLTPEQQKTFDANVAAMPQGRGRPPLSL